MAAGILLPVILWHAFSRTTRKPGICILDSVLSCLLLSFTSYSGGGNFVRFSFIGIPLALG